jgi:hypothetical protein
LSNVHRLPSPLVDVHHTNGSVTLWTMSVAVSRRSAILSLNQLMMVISLSLSGGSAWAVPAAVADALGIAAVGADELHRKIISIFV